MTQAIRDVAHNEQIAFSTLAFWIRNEENLKKKQNVPRPTVRRPKTRTGASSSSGSSEISTRRGRPAYDWVSYGRRAAQAKVKILTNPPHFPWGKTPCSKSCFCPPHFELNLPQPSTFLVLILSRHHLRATPFPPRSCLQNFSFSIFFGLSSRCWLFVGSKDNRSMDLFSFQRKRWTMVLSTLS